MKRLLTGNLMEEAELTPQFSKAREEVAGTLRKKKLDRSNHHIKGKTVMYRPGSPSPLTHGVREKGGDL